MVWVVHPDFSSKPSVVLSKVSSLIPQMECTMRTGSDAVSSRGQGKQEGVTVMSRLTGRLMSALSTRLSKTRLVSSFGLWYGCDQGKPVFFSDVTAWQVLGFCFFPRIQALLFYSTSRSELISTFLFTKWIRTFKKHRFGYVAPDTCLVVRVNLWGNVVLSQPLQRTRSSAVRQACSPWPPWTWVSNRAASSHGKARARGGNAPRRRKQEGRRTSSKTDFLLRF